MLTNILLNFTMQFLTCLAFYVSLAATWVRMSWFNWSIGIYTWQCKPNNCLFIIPVSIFWSAGVLFLCPHGYRALSFLLVTTNRVSVARSLSPVSLVLLLFVLLSTVYVCRRLLLLAGFAVAGVVIQHSNYIYWIVEWWKHRRSHWKFVSFFSTSCNINILFWMVLDFRLPVRSYNIFIIPLDSCIPKI